MCGFAGFYGPSNASSEETLRAMTDAIVHRGPDDQGSWVDPEAGIHLGFRRLSILDLSQAGHQPMVSHCGRYVCVFNGEIYNFQELKDRLGSREFRGHSDTEILLEHIQTFGLEETLKLTAGMFALAVWDRERKELSLARDRLGEKPLYYGWSNGTLFFASELKALRPHPEFQPEIDRNVLALYLGVAYVPSPWSIYRGIYKVPAGSFLTLREPTRPVDFDPFPDRSAHSPRLYWDMKAVANQPRQDLPDAEAVEQLDQILKRTIAKEMISDVPLGGFLSGGIDSSAVVAVMQAVSPKPVRSFTIGFHEGGFNEAEHAKAVAQHLGTDHTELYVTAQETRDVLPLVPQIYDEPFADPSQIPTYLVSKLARQDVTVCLSGDGGDEFFGGYNRYFMAERVWGKVGRMPKPVRRSIRNALTALSPGFYDRVGRVIGSRVRLAGDKAHKLANLMDVKSADEMYVRLVSQWPDPTSIVKGSCPEETVFGQAQGYFSNLGFTERMMATEALTYLPDDIMVKVDRAAMAVSLESRAPFLHHEVAEFAWSLPFRQKVRDDKGKWILRQVLDRYVPRHLIERPKMGFAVPIDSWLRGPLREWAEPLLSRQRLESDGYFEVEPIRRRWEEHLSGRRNWQYQLWCILMFQAWLDSVH